MTSKHSEVKRPSWTRAQIRSARQTPLKPVLERLGYRLLPRPDGNWHIEGLCPDILVKDHYWLCPDTGQAGNAMFTRAVAHSAQADDRLLRIRHMSFNQATARPPKRSTRVRLFHRQRLRFTALRP